MPSFVNNDTVTPVPGDIVRSSGQNFGAVLAQADSTAHADGVLGVWADSPKPGYGGTVNTDGIVEVNCAESVSPGDRLYLSAATAGKATKTAPAIPIFVGTVLSVELVNAVYKASVQLVGSVVKASDAASLAGLTAGTTTLASVQDSATRVAVTPAARTAAEALAADVQGVWRTMGPVFEPSTNPGEPNIMYDSDPRILKGYRKVFKNWFTWTSSGGLGYSESPDCKNWTPGVLVKSLYTRAGHVVRVGATYYMTALNQTTWALDLLSSADGITWAKVSEVDTHANPIWDQVPINNLNNSCLVIDGDQWICVFSGVLATGPRYGIAVATSADRGATWTAPTAVALATPIAGLNVGGTVCGPFVQKVGDTFYVWCQTSPVGEYAPTDIQRFETKNFTTWTQSISGFTFPRFSADTGTTSALGQVADITMCEVDGATYMVFVALFDGMESHLELAIADMTIAQLVTTSEGIDLRTKPELLANRSFEGGAVTGYTTFYAWSDTAGDGAIARTTTAAEVHPDSSRVAACKLTAGATANTQTLQQVSGLTTGASYTFSGWSLGDGTNAGRFDVTTSAGVSLLASPMVKTTPPAAAYVKFSAGFVAPSNGIVKVVLKCPATEAGAVCFDDLSVVEVPEAGVIQPRSVSSVPTRSLADRDTITSTYTGDPAEHVDWTVSIPETVGCSVEITVYSNSGRWTYLRLNGALISSATPAIIDGAITNVMQNWHQGAKVPIAYADTGAATVNLRIGAADAAGNRRIHFEHGGNGQNGIGWGYVHLAALTSVGIAGSDNGTGTGIYAGTKATITYGGGLDSPI